MIFAPTETAERAPRSAGFRPYEGVTYYDLPALKPSHYGWLISAYFYVGGLASAAQFLASMMDLFGGERARPVVRAGRYLALGGALVSPPLLIGDLQTPQRWYNMLRIFRKTSAMSIGSWALSSFGLFSGVVAVGQAMEDFFGWRLGRWLARLVEIPASLAAGVVAIYTGTLLAATNIPLWASGFPLLSSLFASSAASTASAALTLMAPSRAKSVRRGLTWFSLAAGLAELFFAIRVERHWREDGAGQPLRKLPFSAGWWGGVFGLGILAPLALHALQLKRRRESTALDTAAALSTLVGGFLLRAVFVFGGNRSARQPRDYFRMTEAAPSAGAYERRSRRLP